MAPVELTGYSQSPHLVVLLVTDAVLEFLFPLVSIRRLAWEGWNEDIRAYRALSGPCAGNRLN